ncbi:hypothetical protein GTP45_14685 [Pseudoduganella sp. FT55W]|uniref:HD domain-containing protein n=1 Tax=Duganella rivi TaxID=2666083 RepID=A0A7X4GR11_9BURK|nr:hypothetical protein [Duganella rivi]MYM68068.1 hypothetical protein [Duganella rivi]
MAHILTQLPLLDTLHGQHAALLGKDFDAYRNHTYRLVNFCAAQLDADDEALQKMQVAAAFHDLGIWSAHTFDYLPPSDAQAQAWLNANGKQAWSADIAGMINEHHKITATNGSPLVEAFRRADWADVTFGVINHGIPRALRREVFAAFPDAGFHAMLLKLSAKRLLTHPWSPLPMMRW